MYVVYVFHMYFSLLSVICLYATLIAIFPSHYTVPTLTVTLTPNTTRLPNVAPYNTFSLTCTATSRVGGGNVALPKRFTWRRRYGPDTTGLTQLSSNATIQIQDGDNLTQPTSSSMLTVTEDIPRDYRYRCRVDLDLPADNIFNFTDVYPITVTGKCCSSKGSTESVDSLCRDGTNAQYMQYLNKGRITSPQTR